ncbi:hypothetical protein ACN6MY_00580 [Peribacillus sp. B-H-3]|uniref:hypothetical protein n=1 Tax=Peribacillus sp. B-H-3 TaxID=3400420 RepID=UPI003B01B4DF
MNFSMENENVCYSSRRSKSVRVIMKKTGQGGKQPSLARMTFFDSIQYTDPPFKKKPQCQDSYQEYSLRKPLKLTFMEPGSQDERHITVEKKKDKIMIGEKSGNASAAFEALQHMMFKRESSYAFLTVVPDHLKVRVEEEKNKGNCQKQKV